MIIDLRGNIGGALDFSQYFLGFFQGQSQYAFDLFHLGDYVVQRTVTGKLPALARYEETAVLADGMTQSTAEVTTAAMKRLHLAHVVGATTRGWGSVEATYPMKTAIDPSTTYSVLMVSYLTLRDDNQPVEGKGVDPDVAIADKNWRSKLSTSFTSPSLISAIEQTVTKPPQKLHSMEQKHCSHLDQIQDVHAKDKTVCEGCVPLGDEWVSLRMCLTCGHVGCCDSSKNQHATKHFKETNHPIMESVTPGEVFRWCYVDQIYL